MKKYAVAFVIRFGSHAPAESFLCVVDAVSPHEAVGMCVVGMCQTRPEAMLTYSAVLDLSTEPPTPLIFTKHTKIPHPRSTAK